MSNRSEVVFLRILSLVSLIFVVGSFHFCGWLFLSLVFLFLSLVSFIFVDGFLFSSSVSYFCRLLGAGEEKNRSERSRKRHPRAIRLKIKMSGRVKRP